MEKKKNLDILISEAKCLKNLKIANQNMVNNYENNIFPKTIEQYYQNKLSLLFIQTTDNIIKNDRNKIDFHFNTKIGINKELLSIENSKTLLGSYYKIISDFFISLRKNEKIILYILENINGEAQNLLINYISLLYYENVFEIENNNISQSLNSNEIILNKILENLIEKELEEIIINKNNYSKFLDGTLASKIIKNFLKKEDVQNYLRDIFLDLITDVIEMENKNVFMEPNRIRDYLIQKEKKEENLIMKDNQRESPLYKRVKNILIKEKFRNTVFQSNENINNIEKDENKLNYSFVINNPKIKFQNLSHKNILSNNDTDSSNIWNNNNSSKTVFNQNFSSLKDISNLLYEGLTHSRLIYADKEQDNFFNYNEQENNCYNNYKIINIDEYLEIKEKNPEINKDYSKYELSQKELNNLYIKSNKSNKYMEEFYYLQIKELEKDSNKNFSNLYFIKLLKKNYLLYLDKLIPLYKKKFRKNKIFY